MDDRLGRIVGVGARSDRQRGVQSRGLQAVNLAGEEEKT